VWYVAVVVQVQRDEDGTNRREKVNKKNEKRKEKKEEIEGGGERKPKL
jgi:hypothetical protein